MPLTLARTCYFAIPDRTHGGLSQLICPLVTIPRASQHRPTECLRCSKSNHTQFDYIRLHFDVSRTCQTEHLSLGCQDMRKPRRRRKRKGRLKEERENEGWNVAKNTGKVRQTDVICKTCGRLLWMMWAISATCFDPCERLDDIWLVSATCFMWVIEINCFFFHISSSECLAVSYSWMK